MTKYNYTTKNLYASGIDIPYEKTHTKEQSTKFANEIRFNEFKKKFLQILKDIIIKILESKSVLRDIFLDFLYNLQPKIQ